MNLNKEWPEWKDKLGRIYRAGDQVAVATTRGKSPQLLIGEVIKINRVNSKNEPIGRWTIPDPKNAPNDKVFEPSCTVTIKTASRWYRGGDQIYTYQFPNNIVKV